MRLLSNEGEYFYSQFYGKDGGIFTITGTKSAINGKTTSATDYFRTPSGKTIDFKRSEIIEQVQKGNMKPVPGSEIMASAPKVERIKKTKK